MNIAIIGTGNIGAGLARVFGKTKHGVVVADREGGQSAADKLKAEGVRVQATDVATAIKSAETVILATPYGASATIVAEADLNGKIVVDLSNPVTEDFSALQLGHTTSAAEEIARLAPGAKVVKAFNTVFAQHYAGDLKIGGAPIQTFVASDDAEAKATVTTLATDAGFEVRDAGGLSNARYLEPLGYMNIQFGYMLGQGAGIAPKWVG
ncbi:NADPH-dependent F420 reductase [Sedimentimonas flavescens]|uniref:NADPH-dependent F420 reductase n=1 Tax=Sedimentimonas flavescens TaxID=2851012 RepID=UPI001C49F079|nr:NADPH-dependent F420 reductase [Sedimentimonas flavescens]MBW0157507.1 NADPH-dependent F420 reductase [Sedimentimonas flavescens]